jgi:hypothetical protein
MSPMSAAGDGTLPNSDGYGQFAVQADGKEMSTTMAAVRMLGVLLRDKALGPRIVPIAVHTVRLCSLSSPSRSHLSAQSLKQTLHRRLRDVERQRNPQARRPHRHRRRTYRPYVKAASAQSSRQLHGCPILAHHDGHHMRAATRQTAVS